MSRLLARLLSGPFYRRHALLFGALFLLAFGAVKATSLPTYHAALLQTALDYPLFLLLLFVAWTAYFARCAFFGSVLFRSAQGSFLYGLRCWPLRRQALLLGREVLTMEVPVLLYMLLLAGYAVHAHAYATAAVVLLFALAAPALTLLHWLRVLNVPGKAAAGRAEKPRRPKPFATWPLRHLWHAQRRNLLLAKCAGLLLLYIPLVWNRDRFDHDSLPLFLIALVAVNAFFAPALVAFLEGPLRFHRNLPLRGGSIALLLYGTSFLLCLPETLYLFYTGYGLLPLPLLAAIALAPVHTLFALSAVTYGSAPGSRDAWTLLGGLSFVSLFFFNSEAYAYWDALLLLVGSVLFAANYRRHEGAGNTG